MKTFPALLFLALWCCGAAENTTDPDVPEPVILYFHVNTDIRLRYARTVFDTKVSNSANVSQEVSFSATLPESAFISEFKIVVDGHEYKAYVREKEEARREYEEAVSQGRTAAHVAMNARDSQRFTVSLNVEPEKKVTFILTYEELLSRKLGVYSHVLNLDPGEVVQDFSVTVRIKEHADITKLNVPALRTNNEITDTPGSNSLATIDRPSSHTAVVKFSPTPEQQRELASEGIKGQLVVEYDVDRSEHSSEVLMEDGYFVHFFAPEELPPLRKHVSFVLDVSGSMSGRKIEQLKQAMTTILDEMNPNDTFSIAIFSSSVQVWDYNLTDALLSERIGRLTGMRWGDYGEEEEEVEIRNRHVIASATPENITRAKEFIEMLQTVGATNINEAMLKGLELSKLAVARDTVHTEDDHSQQGKPHPILIFLTDGRANVGVQNLNQIVKNAGVANTGNCSIFALGLGSDVDFGFLKKLSLRNFGFARKIYEASDTALQLRDFYRFVASPLLSHVTFKYHPEQVFPNTLTKYKYLTVFSGSEIVVAGKVVQDNFTGEVEGLSQTGRSVYTVVPVEPSPTNTTTGFMERVWAYLTIKQLLDKKEANSTSTGEDGDDGSEEELDDFISNNQTILDLALKYSFVTPLTSLVVVKPNETSAVNIEDASGIGGASPISGVLKAGIQPSAGQVFNTIRSSPPVHSHFVDVTQVTWLPQVTHNGTVTLHTGTDGTTEEFQFGSQDEPNVAHSECTSPLHQSGHCRHFRYCILDAFKNSEQDFLPHFCRIDNYVGVCCPDNLHPVATS